MVSKIINFGFRSYLSHQFGFRTSKEPSFQGQMLMFEAKQRKQMESQEFDVESKPGSII